MEELADTSNYANTEQSKFEESCNQVKMIFEQIMKSFQSNDDMMTNSEDMPIPELKKLSEFVQTIVDDPD